MSPIFVAIIGPSRSDISFSSFSTHFRPTVHDYYARISLLRPPTNILFSKPSDMNMRHSYNRHVKYERPKTSPARSKHGKKSGGRIRGKISHRDTMDYIPEYSTAKEYWHFHKKDDEDEAVAMFRKYCGVQASFDASKDISIDPLHDAREFGVRPRTHRAMGAGFKMKVRRFRACASKQLRLYVFFLCTAQSPSLISSIPFQRHAIAIVISQNPKPRRKGRTKRETGASERAGKKSAFGAWV